jgi:hypothetical protein
MFLLMPLAFGAAAIFNGDYVKMLKPNINLKDTAYILTGSDDPSTSATLGPIGSLYLSQENGVYAKQDSGSTTNWKKLETSANINTNTFDVNIDGVSTSDATNLAISSETTIPIKGSGSLAIAKTGNQSGDYVTLKAFTLTGVVNSYGQYEVCLGLNEVSSTFVDNDLRVSIYDVTNSKEIRAGKEYILANSLPTKQCFGPFQMGVVGTQYQVRLTVANANTNNWTMVVDGTPDSDAWYVGPAKEAARGAIITDWEAYTPTLTNLTASVNEFEWKRVGDSIFVRGRISVTTVTGEIKIGFPSGVIISAPNTDRSNFVQAVDSDGTLHSGMATSVDGSNYFVIVDDSVLTLWTTGAPFTWASGDGIVVPPIQFKIQGWSSNVVLSSESSGREIVFEASRSTSQNIPTGTLTLVQYNTITNGSQFWDGTDEFIVPESAWYLTEALTEISGNSSGYRDISIAGKQGKFIPNGQCPATSLYEPVMSIAYKLKGEKIGVSITQDSGSTLTLGASGARYNRISIYKLSSSSQTIAASEKVYVEAAGNSGIAISSSVNIHFTEVEDSHGAWDGDEFTAPYTGVFSFSGTVVLTTGVNQAFYIYKDGVNTGKICGFINSSSQIHVINGKIKLNAGEKMSIRVSSAATLSNNASHTLIITSE